MPSIAPPIDDEQRYIPFWLRWFPFIVRAPLMTRRQWRIFALIALVAAFNRYDLALFSIALSQIQKSLGIAESQVGTFAAIVQLGAIPAIGLFWLGDWIGRRQALILAFAGHTLLTGLTAFAPSATVFVILQFAARAFATSGITIAGVMFGEELDANTRGWGIGAFGAMAACGYAAAWGLFAMIDILPFGWRFMYIVGALGFVFLAMVRRHLPETRRFVRLDKPESPLKPFVSLIRMYPGRIAALGATLMLISLGSQAPSFFDPKYLQEAHGWTPGQVSLMALIGGALIVFVPTYAGWFSDQFGRKRVTMFLLAVYPALIIGFYNSSGILLPVFWILYVAVGVGMTITLATYGVELFPTSYRSTATGAQSILLNVGAVMSLALESVLFDLGGSHWVAVSLLSMAIILTPLILMRFPETSRRALEDIAPER